VFNYFQNDISLLPPLAPAVNQSGAQGRPIQSGVFSTSLTFFTLCLLTSGETKAAYPQVVIPVKKTAAPKQAQAKKASTKTATKKTSKSSPPGSDSGSSDSSDLEIEVPPEPSPIPPIRPTDPIAAAEYDTLQAVWSPRNKRVGVDKVKSAIDQFQKLTKVVRDSWKTKSQAMKVAENKGDNVEATKLKEEVIFQRNTMDQIVKTALEMGHPTVVEKYVAFYLHIDLLKCF
jgi:hypothetical protein